MENHNFEKKISSLKHNSPYLKSEFPQQVKQIMKSTICKCVVNVTPVANPMPMSESDKYNVNAMRTKIRPQIDFYMECRIDLWFALVLRKEIAELLLLGIV